MADNKGPIRFEDKPPKRFGPSGVHGWPPQAWSSPERVTARLLASICSAIAVACCIGIVVDAGTLLVAWADGSVWLGQWWIGGGLAAVFLSLLLPGLVEEDGWMLLYMFITWPAIRPVALGLISGLGVAAGVAASWLGWGAVGVATAVVASVASCLVTALTVQRFK